MLVSCTANLSGLHVFREAKWHELGEESLLFVPERREMGVVSRLHLVAMPRAVWVRGKRCRCGAIAPRVAEPFDRDEYIECES